MKVINVPGQRTTSQQYLKTVENETNSGEAVVGHLEREKSSLSVAFKLQQHTQLFLISNQN